MLKGSFQRAAMAILLMGLMMAPLGICLQPAQKGAHSCCPQQSETPGLLPINCCIVRTELPATLVAPTLTSASHPPTAFESMSLEAMPAPNLNRIARVSLPLSPPPGTFILRI
jgi:hypothetical protein